MFDLEDKDSIDSTPEDGLDVDTMSSPTIDNLQDYARQDPEFGLDIAPPGQAPDNKSKKPHASKPSDVLGSDARSKR